MRFPLIVALGALPLLSQASPLTIGRNQSPNTRVLKTRDDDVNIASLYNYQDDHWEMRVHKSCDDGQRQEIINSIAEAGYLVNALRQWSPNGAYQNSMDKYMGSGSTGGQKSAIQDTISNQWNLHTSINPAGVQVIAYCDETVEEVSRSICKNNPKTGAYSWDNSFTGRRFHYVVLCPAFFDDAQTKPLGQMLNEARADPKKQKSVWGIYASRGSVWLHETFHWGTTITNPRAEDAYNGKLVYGPSSVADFAAEAGAAGSVHVADSWTITALSNMMMQSFGLSEPPSELKTFSVNGEDQDYRLGTADVNVDDKEPPSDDDLEAQASSYTRVSGKMAKIDTNDYASKAPASLPECDPNDDKCYYTSSCGTEWMPLDDWTDNKGSQYSGYNNLIEKFCTVADGKPVAAGGYLTLYGHIGLDQGEDPKTHAKNGIIEFEVHNKMKEDSYEVKHDDCITYLKEFTRQDNKGKHCYGPDHVDTKGGSYQIGKDAVSFHAIGHKGDLSVEFDVLIEGTSPVDDGADPSEGGSPFDTTVE